MYQEMDVTKKGFLGYFVMDYMGRKLCAETCMGQMVRNLHVPQLPWAETSLPQQKV